MIFVIIASKEFCEKEIENGEAEMKQFYDTAEKGKQQIASRSIELDNIIRCLYYDRVFVGIFVKPYDAMALIYETQQMELKQKLAFIHKKIQKIDMLGA